MESFTEKKKKLAKVNTADIDPMHVTHTRTILLVYPGFLLYGMFQQQAD